MNKEKETLIKRLQEANLSTRRFLKVGANKAAFEKDWQLHLYTPEELKDYPRWGICGGKRLVLVDSDKPKMAENLRRVLPATLEVLTPRRKLLHFLLMVIDGDVENKTLYLPETNEAAGEIRASNQYLVAAGTEITFEDLETGETKTGTYKILNDRPIAKISYIDFMEAIKPFLGKDSSQRLTEEQIRKGVTEGERHNVGIRYANYLIGVHGLDFAAALVEMNRWNKLCNPPNNEEEIKQMVYDAINYQKTKPKQHDIAYQKMRVSLEINPVLLAKDIMEDYVFVVEEQSRILFVYDPETGGYSELAEERIKREIAKRLDDNARSKFFNDVHFFIEATAPIKPFCDVAELMLCENGILNIKSRVLFPFSPDYFLVNKLPVIYDPAAKIEAVDVFLKNVLGEREIRTLQEFLGYCLYRKITFHKALLLVGTGRNGKGVTLNLITAFLGKENCSSETLQNICYNRFSTANLYCKLANISADLPSNLIKYTGMFKMVVGGDMVPNERKCVTAFPYNPYAKNLFSANFVPPIANTEDCDAFYARWLILEYKKQFLGDKADKHLIEKLTTPVELSGLLNWALDGLERICENNDFSMKENIAEMRKQYIKRSNSVKAFIEECIEVTSDFNDFLPSKYSYTKFLDYCNQNQIKSKSQREFIENMKEHCLGADFRATRLNEEQQEKFGEDKKIPNAWHYIKNVGCVGSVPLLAIPLKNTEIIPDQKKTNTTNKTNKAAEKPLDIDSAFGDGKLPACFNCKKTVYDPNQLTNLDGQFYCKTCRDSIISQRKGAAQ